MIPLSEDIMKLQNHLKALEQRAVKELTEGPNPAAGKSLLRNNSVQSDEGGRSVKVTLTGQETVGFIQKYM